MSEAPVSEGGRRVDGRRDGRRDGRVDGTAERRRLRQRNTGIAVVFALLLCLGAVIGAVNALSGVDDLALDPDRTADTAGPDAAPATPPALEGASPAPAADPAAPPAPAAPPPPAPVAFSSPSGNIGCALSVDGARCDIVDRLWDPGPPPAECTATWGAGVRVGPDGAGLVCAGDTVLGSAAPLAYGATAEVGTFRCTSTEAGVRCEDLATGRGFALARTDYTVF